MLTEYEIAGIRSRFGEFRNSIKPHLMEAIIFDFDNLLKDNQALRREVSELKKNNELTLAEVNEMAIEARKPKGGHPGNIIGSCLGGEIGEAVRKI